MPTDPITQAAHTDLAQSPKHANGSGFTPQERYCEKPFFGSSHVWALAQCSRLPADARVLDLGPGSGIMGRKLLERDFSELYAVEIDPDARVHVAPYYKQVEETIAPFQDHPFDAILVLDVLEHTAEPDRFLEELASIVKPQGMILISLPNIAHWSVRLPLLFGVFEYQKRGILDRTHLQFFTRRRFLRMLRSLNGFAVQSVDSTLEPAELVLPRALWDNPIYRAIAKVRLLAARVLPGFFAYQHLAVLRRRN